MRLLTLAFLLIGMFAGVAMCVCIIEVPPEHPAFSMFPQSLFYPLYTQAGRRGFHVVVTSRAGGAAR